MKNLARKFLSFIFAVIIWIIIYNIYDPIITKKIDDIPVTLINENAITDIGKIYKITNNENISIYISGKQSLIKNLTNKDIKATANLQNLSITNSVNIDVTIPKLNAENIEIQYEKNNTLTLSLDNYVSKTFALKINKENEINDKYYLHNDNCHARIKISGAQEKIKEIQEVVINVSLSDLNPNYSKAYDIILLNNFGEQISDDELELNQYTYIYAPIVYEIKEIPINIKTIGEVPYGYLYNTEDFYPKFAKITGPKETLDLLTQINIEYDKTNTKELLEIKYNLKEYLPEEIIVLDENFSTLTVDIEKLETKTYEIKTSDLTVKNIPEGYVVKYNPEHKMSITIMGEKEFVENLTIEKISPYVDLKGSTEGKYILDINIPEALNLEVIETCTVDITIEPQIIETITPIPPNVQIPEILDDTTNTEQDLMSKDIYIENNN